MNEVEILEKGKALIADPARWCRGIFHSWDKKKLCMVSSSLVVQGLATEPLKDGYDNTSKIPASLIEASRKVVDALDLIHEEDKEFIATNPWSIVCTANNGLDHAGVMAVYDDAIVIAKAKLAA
jgi:hypothetical protein